MHRGPRFSAALLAATLIASAGSSALAQSNAVAPPPPPREGTVGPEQLRDFSLGGPRQEPAPEQQPPAQSAPAPAATERPPVATSGGDTTPQAAAPSRPAATPSVSQQAGPVERSSPPEGRGATSAPAPEVSVGLPPATPAPNSPFDFGPAAPPATTGVDTAPLTTAESGPSPWPWLLVLAAVVAAGLFLLHRRRTSAAAGALAFAGPAPAPAPAPMPRPVPAPAPRATPAPPPVAAPRPLPEPPAPAASPAPAPSHPKGVGIVSTRLRPWLDVDVAVVATILTDEELQLHLQMIVANTGSTPARQVGVEVVALNAGAEQDRELATYFERPDPEPRAADMIAPLDQVVLQSVVRMPRTAFREYSAGGGRVLVPLVAVNASYRAGSSIGRTSAAFLIGRGTPETEKLGPLRTDQGPRQYGGVIARRTNLGVRR